MRLADRAVIRRSAPWLPTAEVVVVETRRSLFATVKMADLAVEVPRGIPE